MWVWSRFCSTTVWVLIRVDLGFLFLFFYYGFLFRWYFGGQWVVVAWWSWWRHGGGDWVVEVRF